jgi:hypothetical protein
VLNNLSKEKTRGLRLFTRYSGQLLTAVGQRLPYLFRPDLDPKARMGAATADSLLADRWCVLWSMLVLCLLRKHSLSYEYCPPESVPTELTVDAMIDVFFEYLSQQGAEKHIVFRALTGYNAEEIQELLRRDRIKETRSTAQVLRDLFPLATDEVTEDVVDLSSAEEGPSILGSLVLPGAACRSATLVGHETVAE